MGNHSEKSRERVDGVQIATLFNSAHAVNGVQAAMLVNWGQGAVRGVQGAWMTNLVGEDLYGIQLSGVNWVRNAVHGVQLAPSIVTALNLTDEVHGAQVSIGILSLNMTQKLRGL